MKGLISECTFSYPGEFIIVLHVNLTYVRVVEEG